ncbi:hypothetical protein [Hyphomicrobium sp.]|uniref:hypothetical protein n=1 Tax=Hyphomicrobium sp. TaxID=82 RepID=UPI000F91872D|nr:hypothetical protein [Hyphomicrobium sp.]RUP07884.1 MAG: hypothetical protein EKK38_17190 [Hyphomicrobium sp.]
MRIASPSRLMMVARTDKEARLKDFIGDGLLPRDEGLADRKCLTLFVRNPDSPVARALCAAWSEGRVDNTRIRILICDTNSEEAASGALFDIAHAEFRVLADQNFGSAHEQLVVGEKSVWIGDCLRRDPTKRDAFELFHPNETTTAVFATASFEKLWVRGRPLKPFKSESVAPEIIAVQSGEPDALPRNPRH